MAPLTDAERLAAYKDALANWSFASYIRFDLNDQAYDWLDRELDNISTKELGRLMYEHVLNGGEIDEIRETRPEWSGKYAFHYDLRLAIRGRLVYIETRLHLRLPVKPDDSWVEVVNVHAC